MLVQPDQQACGEQFLHGPIGWGARRGVSGTAGGRRPGQGVEKIAFAVFECGQRCGDVGFGEGVHRVESAADAPRHGVRSGCADPEPSGVAPDEKAFAQLGQRSVHGFGRGALGDDGQQRGPGDRTLVGLFDGQDLEHGQGQGVEGVRSVQDRPALLCPAGQHCQRGGRRRSQIRTQRHGLDQLRVCASCDPLRQIGRHVGVSGRSRVGHRLSD